MSSVLVLTVASLRPWSAPFGSTTHRANATTLPRPKHARTSSVEHLVCLSTPSQKPSSAASNVDTSMARTPVCAW